MAPEHITHTQTSFEISNFQFQILECWNYKVIRPHLAFCSQRIHSLTVGLLCFPTGSQEHNVIIIFLQPMTSPQVSSFIKNDISRVPSHSRVLLSPFQPLSKLKSISSLHVFYTSNHKGRRLNIYQLTLLFQYLCMLPKQKRQVVRRIQMQKPLVLTK